MLLDSGVIQGEVGQGGKRHLKHLEDVKWRYPATANVRRQSLNSWYGRSNLERATSINQRLRGKEGAMCEDWEGGRSREVKPAVTAQRAPYS